MRKMVIVLMMSAAFALGLVACSADLPVYIDIVNAADGAAAVLAIGDEFSGLELMRVFYDASGAVLEQAHLMGRMPLVGQLQNYQGTFSYKFIVDEEFRRYIPLFPNGREQPYVLFILSPVEVLGSFDLGGVTLRNIWNPGAFCGARAAINVTEFWMNAHPSTPDVIFGRATALSRDAWGMY